MVRCPDFAGSVVTGRETLDCDTEGGGFSFWVISKAPTALQIPKICANSKCLAVISMIQKAQPTECVVPFGFTLYGEILNPILSQCAAHPEYAPGLSKTVIAVIAVACLIAVAVGVHFFRRHRARLCVRKDADEWDDLERDSHVSELSSYGYARRSPRTQYNNAASTTIASTAATIPSEKRSDYAGPMPVDAAMIPLLQDRIVLDARIRHSHVAIGDHIASGTYGSVYAGEYKKMKVAIKQLRKGVEADVPAINTFMEEIKLIASLSHPCIVQFFGVAWTKPENVCVVMEYMGGGDLYSVLHKFDTVDKRPPGFDPMKFKIALDVAEALAYLHARSPIVIHRDLKSNNILLTSDYAAKVTDFGVSREHVNDKMTMRVGTQRWMAPEVIKGQDYDEKADVFSFGIVLSELDTNKIPYANHALGGMPPLAIMSNIANGQLVVEFSYSSDPHIVALGRQCVSLDPRQRPSMREARDRVAAIWGKGNGQNSKYLQQDTAK